MFKWLSSKSSRSLNYKIEFEGKIPRIKVNQFLDFEWSRKAESYFVGSIEDTEAMIEGLQKALYDAKRLQRCIRDD